MCRFKAIIFFTTLLLLSNTAQAQVEAIFYVLDGLRFLPGNSSQTKGPKEIQPKLSELKITHLGSLKDIPKAESKNYFWYKSLTVYNPTDFSDKNVNIPEGLYTWNGAKWTKTYASTPAGSLKGDLQALYDLQQHSSNKDIKEWNNWVIDLENPESISNIANLNGVFFRKIDGEYRVVELRLDKFYYSDITVTKGLEALVYLSISNNPNLRKIDLKLSNLVFLENNQNNWLISVDLDCPKLMLARLNKNRQLVSLNTSNCPQLSYLWVSGNSLASLNTLKNAELAYLICPDNLLTTIDVSGNAKLAYLNCYKNALTSLDLSHNKALELLICSENKLTTLDVSKNLALQRLGCNNNHFKSLNVSVNHALTELRCSMVGLLTLDLSRNTNLKILDCSHNYGLIALDFSKNINLTELNCSQNNRLTSLNVSNCTQLKSLKCSQNKLTSLDLSRLAKLEELNCNFSSLHSTPKSIKICSKALTLLSKASENDNQVFFPGKDSPSYQVVNCK